MKYLICLLALLLAGCAEKVQNAPQPGDVIMIPEIEWRIVDQAQLEKVYRDSGMPLDERQSLQGFVGKKGDRWIVYTLPVKTVDDNTTLTLGHEILHVVLGDYHGPAMASRSTR